MSEFVVVVVVVHFIRRNSLSATCASAANAISTDSGIVRGRSVLINDLLDLDIVTK